MALDTVPAFDRALLSPARLGPLVLRNKAVMAPMTRSRAGDGDAPTAMNALYYAQRASAGLIISEATQISPQGKGYMWAPGLYSEAQIAGWTLVTEAVHAKGGLIFAQLWHVGRMSHPDVQEGGILPVAPSAIRPENARIFTKDGYQPPVVPRALELAEIPGIVEQFRVATEAAIRAGFDGVELHAAGGYLIDQFLRDGCNKRTDRYGGSLENRARLLMEVTQAVADVIGAERVGVRLAPFFPVNDCRDSDPKSLFSYVVEQLNRFGLSYLHIIEVMEGMTPAKDLAGDYNPGTLRRLFKGPYMACFDYDLARAEQALRNDEADLIAFGRPFIANPDLVERFRAGVPLAEADPATFYGGDAKGYIDYSTAT
jgi:N-ethylmaleimide reductase